MDACRESIGHPLPRLWRRLREDREEPGGNSGQSLVLAQEVAGQVESGRDIRGGPQIERAADASLVPGAPAIARAPEPDVGGQDTVAGSVVAPVVERQRDGPARVGGEDREQRLYRGAGDVARAMPGAACGRGRDELQPCTVGT